jgi:hypothetical protein
MKYLALLIPLLAVSCQHGPNARGANASLNNSAHAHAPTTRPVRAPYVDSSLTHTHADGDIYVLLDVYTMKMPLGGISKNDDFWNLIDQQHVDQANHELLLRNGIRYGIGDSHDWEKKLKPIFDQAGAISQKGSVDIRRAAVTELPMRTGVEQQDLFFINEKGTLYGRTYQHCDNLFVFGFSPAPDNPWNTRLSMSAIVRDLRYEFVVTERNQTTEVERKRPDYLYDLKLSTLVPQDHFLVVAPSANEDLPCNLGSTFLTQPAGAQPMETVLLLVPRTGQLREQLSAGK